MLKPLPARPPCLQQTALPGSTWVSRIHPAPAQHGDTASPKSSHGALPGCLGAEMSREEVSDAKGFLRAGFFLLGFFFSLSLLASARQVDELSQYIFCLERKHISYISLTSYYSSLSEYVCIQRRYNSPFAALVERDRRSPEISCVPRHGPGKC